ncbi:uncharacterized protein BO72DRAFT_461113 [Aspergillus fijiensis CBS 313.89]|uniref:Uncharacterized protein n=1 Tax=Aspergillus fijiensis CBS 313.89 TaxID=1448319 RepID=A0A8G1RM42_9EURO|nr:uncharacterized protein BO72DRAFT_461113 [Aspergillus fijiensis CBS 313.89]RAK74663.1 hypothetical protein BO72DRAFT_461113 [Aspergillus fijiensis CBS 313.89]
MGIFSVKIPLLEVSKEAHKVAQVWVQRQSPSLEVDVDNDTYTENHNRLAMRRFNPRRDIVFCPDDKWKDFLGEIWNIFYVLSIEGPGRYPEHYNLIRRVALPQQMLMDSRLAPLRKVFSMGVQL